MGAPMRLLRQARLRLRSLARRRRVDAELDEELRYHLDRQTELNRAAGMRPREARAASRRLFGAVEPLRQECRDARGVQWIEAAGHDLRDAFRSLRRNPLFVLLSALCLAIGIGTNTLAFTFMNGLFLRALPVEAPEQLIAVQAIRRGDDPRNVGPVSYPDFVDWQAATTGLADLAAERALPLRVAINGQIERQPGAGVSSNYFSLFGIQPAYGRGFVASDEAHDAAPVVLLSYVFWRDWFGADPTIVGRSIIIDGTPRIVVGVLPAALSHVAPQRVLGSPRLWVPLAPVARNQPRDDRTLRAYGRLADGATREGVIARLAPITRTTEMQHPAESAGWEVSSRPLRIGFSDRTRGMLLTGMGGVLFVLLIACANVANLTLARTTARQNEMAVRLALGAARPRLVRQLLTESLLVALASVPMGVALASWGRVLLLAGASPELASGLLIDRQVLAFSIGLAVLASLLAGLAPAWLAVRRVRHHALMSAGARSAAGGTSHGRLSGALVVGEVTLSVVLLIGAALFLQSFRNLLEAPGTFDTTAILTATVDLSSVRDADTPESAVPRVTALVDRLRTLPGVVAAAAAGFTPLRDGGVRVPIVTDVGGEASPAVLLGGVTDGFFDVLSVPVLEGRTFTAAEARSRSAVAIVNETMAGRIWPGENPVGRRFRSALDDGDGWFTVIGVAAGIITWEIGDRVLPAAYLPYPYSLHDEDQPHLLVRTGGDPGRLTTPMRTATLATAPDVPLLGISTMNEVLADALSRDRSLASFLVVLAGLALILGVTGVYGVLAHYVSQRTHEIGIRAALGADRRRLVRLFIGHGLRMTLAGIVFGLAGAWGLARVVRGELHDVDPADPLTFGFVAVLFAGAGLLAAWVPARRAAHVDPLTAMRE